MTNHKINYNTNDNKLFVKTDCSQCQHYYITWETNHPYGCRYFKFKSPQQPSLMVVESSQQGCLAFHAKQQSTQNYQNDLSDNRKKGWIA